MAATSTPTISSLANQLAHDYPQFQFVADERSFWEQPAQTIHYDTAGGPAQLLHELGHALHQHHSYSRDITLLDLEREAWNQAVKSGKQYNIAVTPAIIDEHLDTYRDWLHARSTCPDCSETGVQNAATTYRCLSCGSQWRVNEARSCQLKRYKKI